MSLFSQRNEITKSRMKIAIVGAGRNRNGIGEYTAKYFHQNGVSVTAVMATTEANAKKASSALKTYGIDATAYADFDKMLKNEQPDCVAIASPSETHYEYILKSIAAGSHVFCEKPFIFSKENNLSAKLDNIFEAAEKKNIKIAMNSQWPFSIPFYEQVSGPVDRQKIETFFIKMSPLCFGKEMIPEAVPHALSILYAFCGEGRVEDIEINSSEKDMTIELIYRAKSILCKVQIVLESKREQPRDFLFGFNGQVVKRVLDMENYDMYFCSKDKKLKINDPLELSVKNFISVVKGEGEPIIGKPHILNNMYLLEKIYNKFRMN